MSIQLSLVGFASPGLQGKVLRDVEAKIESIGHPILYVSIKEDQVVQAADLPGKLFTKLTDAQKTSIQVLRLVRHGSPIDTSKTFKENGITNGAFINIHCMFS